MDETYELIESYSDEMKETLMELLRYPSIGPDNDGEGEMARAEYLMNILPKFGFDEIKRFDAPDERVPSERRPNIVAVKEGRSDKSVVIIAHLDIVPPGDLDEWDIDPFEPVFKDGKIYGRGSEDNGQEIIASIFTARALDELEVKHEYNLKVMLVSDEETGSEYGIDHLLEKDLIDPDDLVIVPDHSEEHGMKIEIVEKSALWVKVTTHGRQGHAAILDNTINANRVGAKYMLETDKRLHETFQQEEELFNPSVSTFEPTKREANVPNINTVPGSDIQYFDCRILPSIDIDEVKDVFESTANEISEETGASFDIEFTKEKSSPQRTPKDAEVVIELKKALKDVTGEKVGLVGIGGGTVAAHIREKGIPAVVWCSNDEMAHQSNEYSHLKYIVKDCKVFTKMVIG
ncbi:MAG: M20 family metallo-hydrolase [Candidatus Saliniplasma sp.]